jgi:hypothetical protein
VRERQRPEEDGILVTYIASTQRFEPMDPSAGGECRPRVGDGFCQPTQGSLDESPHHGRASGDQRISGCQPWSYKPSAGADLNRPNCVSAPP